jgi:hypothetical protein
MVSENNILVYSCLQFDEHSDPPLSNYFASPLLLAVVGIASRSEMFPMTNTMQLKV